MALESIYTIVTYEIVEKTFQSLNFKSNAIMRQYNRTVLQQILLTYFQSAMKQATEALFILSQFR